MSVLPGFHKLDQFRRSLGDYYIRGFVGELQNLLREQIQGGSPGLQRDIYHLPTVRIRTIWKDETPMAREIKPTACLAVRHTCKLIFLRLENCVIFSTYSL